MFNKQIQYKGQDNSHKVAGLLHYLYSGYDPHDVDYFWYTTVGYPGVPGRPSYWKSNSATGS